MKSYLFYFEDDRERFVMTSGENARVALIKLRNFLGEFIVLVKFEEYWS